MMGLIRDFTMRVRYYYGSAQSGVESRHFDQGIESVHEVE
jgi:hypothetical protein